MSSSNHEENEIARVEIAANDYAARGWAVTPLKPKDKIAFLSAWTKGLKPPKFEKYFRDGRHNIGLVLGDISGGLVDIDLDCVEATRLATKYFPLTEAKFGRKDRVLTHLFYTVMDPGRSVKFQDEILAQRLKQEGETAKAMIVEYRANGAQTMVPPSVHPDEKDRRLCWHPGVVDPFKSSRQELLASCAMLAMAVMRERYSQDEINNDELASKNFEEWRQLADLAVENTASIDDQAQQTELKPLIDSCSDKSVFWQINNLALKHLDLWVPHLGLSRITRDADGSYSGVAEWRSSSTGRELDKRDKNLSFDRRGIRDFGHDNPRTSNGGYTAIDVVMAMGLVTNALAAARWLMVKIHNLELEDPEFGIEQCAENDTLIDGVNSKAEKNIHQTRFHDIGKPKLYVDKVSPEGTLAKLSNILAQSGRIYNRGIPVFVTEDKSINAHSAVQLDGYSGVSIAHEISRPWGYVKRSDSIFEEDIALPQIFIKMYLSRPDRYQNLSLLNGISSAPLLREGGYISSRPGYDKLSGFFVERIPNLDGLIPEHPSLGEAAAALLVLRRHLSTFCFADSDTVMNEAGLTVVDLDKVPGIDESGAICALLTAVCRSSLDLAPLISITAAETSGAGTGKGKLFRTICEIAYGQQPRAFTAGPAQNSDELDKRIGASLIEGVQSIMLDNLNGMTLRSDTLASVVTENPATIRELGKSKMLKVNPSCFIGLTGNGLKLSEDLVRRAIIIELDARVEDPENRQFTEDPTKTAKAHRSELLAAALTIWRWGQQNQLSQGKSIGSFEQWASWVRDPLLALGCPDPIERTKEAKLHDPRRQRQAELFATWWEQHGDEPVTIKDLHYSVVQVVNPDGRSRQFTQSRIAKLVGTRVAGFALHIAKKASHWDVDHYFLERTDIPKAAE